MNQDSHQLNIYECKDCGAIWNEEDLESVKIDGYYRLYCAACGGDDIHCVSEEVK